MISLKSKHVVNLKIRMVINGCVDGIFVFGITSLSFVGREVSVIV